MNLKHLEKRAEKIEANQFKRHEKRRAEKAAKKAERKRKKEVLARHRSPPIEETYIEPEIIEEKKGLFEKVKFWKR